MRTCRRRRAAIILAAVVALVVSGVSGGAFASETGWPLDGPADTLVGFGERYTAEDGAQATHRGVDLAADPGSSVRAVLGGTVSFAGRVPAGEGATTIAVTVRTGDLRITLMPLAETSVRAGDVVAPGDVLGKLAAVGDRSHPSPHLHVGVRRGDLYIDPVPFLSAPAPGPTPSDERDARVPAPAKTPAPVPAPQPAPAVGAQTSAVTAGATGAAQPSGVGATAAASGLQGAGSLSSSAVGGATVTGEVSAASAPAAERAGTVSEPIPDAAAPTAAAQGAQGAQPGLPAGLEQAARAFNLEPDRVHAALSADRRPLSATGASPLSLGALLAAVGLVTAALLWPVWRSVPLPGADISSVREDVAAVVAR